MKKNTKYLIIAFTVYSLVSSTIVFGADPKKLTHDQIILISATTKNFDNVDLNGVSLDGTNLQGASFVNANLTNATLKNANLSFSDFKGANLNGTDFLGANLTGARNFETANNIGHALNL